MENSELVPNEDILTKGVDFKGDDFSAKCSFCRVSKEHMLPHSASTFLGYRLFTLTSIFQAFG